MCNRDIKVTVYCLAYNHEKYIRDALEGFVKQETNFQYEVLVHDDASTDGTAAIIKEYELKYPNIIKPIYQDKNTYSKNINITYEYLLPSTNGEYIALCEGDDYWTDPYKLQKQYEYMEEHLECSLVAHKTICNYVEEKYCEPFTNYDFSKNENCELRAEDIINNHRLFHTSSLFFRKQFYYNNKEFLVQNRNFDYVIKILLATEGVVHIIPEDMSVYRKGVEGSWSKNVSSVNDKYIEHMKYAIEILAKIDAYRNYIYSEAIKRNILQRQFNIYVEERAFEKIKCEEYKNIYEKLSFKRKVVLFLKEYCPKLSDIILSGALYRRLRRIIKK